MNSSLLFLLLLLTGCGVKGDPAIPQQPPFKSLMENYPDIQTEGPINEARRRR